MPDLSNLLGAVYGDGPSTGSDPEDEAHVEKEPAAAERGPAVPDWADDDHLDAAFAQWKPGPSTDAAPAEHAFAKDADDEAVPPLPDDLAAALSEALVAASGTADDSVEAATGQRPSPRFDFSIHDDEDDDPTEEAEPPQAFAPLQPVETPAPQPVEETVAETVEPVVDAEPDPEPEPVELKHVDEPEPVELKHVDEPEEMPRPSITTQREAAAELTAASRLEPAPVAAEPDPEPEPMPLASLPVAAVPEPTLPARAAGDGATAPTTVPAGTRRWERSDDDILPEKQAKKLFSFSLRRG